MSASSKRALLKMALLFPFAFRMRRSAAAWLGAMATIALFAGLWPSAGHAGPVTYANTTDAIPYNGASPTGGAAASSIGSPFQTPQVVVNQTGDVINLQFSTNFTNPDTVGSQTAYAADIFLATGANASANPIAPSAYNFAIAVGDQTANGGTSAVGLYQVAASGFKTAQNIWSSRSGFIYGGEYALASNLGDAQAPPVTMTSGTSVSGWTVTDSWNSTGLDVILTAANNSDLATLAGMDDLFWATADCDNGPIFEEISIATNKVAEPGSLALLAVGLAGWLLLRRRPGSPGFAAMA